MPIGHPQAQCAPARNPVVVMTKSEAEALALAVNRSRVRIVRDIAQRERANKHRANVNKPPADCAELRADLDALAKFYEAHCEAHGLGGY